MAFTTLYEGKVGSSSPYPSIYLAYEHERSGSSMKYRFKWKMYLYNQYSSSVFLNNIRFRIYLNGNKVFEKNHQSSSAGSNWTISGTTSWYTVSNKTSGTTPCYFTAVDTNTGSVDKKSTTWSLKVDPAGFTSTPKISVKNRYEDKIILNWSTSETCNSITGVYGTISSTTGLPGKSGTITYTGLTPNYTRSLQAKFKRQDSGLTSNSNKLTDVATYDWPKVTAMNDFIVNVENPTVTLYNPLNRSVILTLHNKDNPDDFVLARYSGTGAGTIHDSFTNNVKTQIDSITSGRSAKYFCKVVTTVSGTSHTKTYEDSSKNTYSLDPNDGEFTPEFSDNNILSISDTSIYQSIINDNNKFINNHNNLKIVLDPMESKSADETKAPVDNGKYVLKINNSQTQIKYQNEIETEGDDEGKIVFNVPNISSNTIQLDVYNNRGLMPDNYNSSKTIDILQYSNPKIKGTVKRKNGLGVEADCELKINISNWDIFSGDNSKWNSVITSGDNSIKYKWKENNESGTWSSWINIPSGFTLTPTPRTDPSLPPLEYILNTIISPNSDGFDTTKSYLIEFKISDRLESVESEEFELTTANAFIWKDLQNLFLGIKKKPECELDINGDLNVDGTLTSNGDLNVDGTLTSNGAINANDIINAINGINILGNALLNGFDLQNVLHAGAGYGSITLGRLGIEWGNTTLTSNTSLSTSNPFSIYAGSDSIDYILSYKYTPRVFTAFSSRYLNQLSCSGVAGTTSATIGMYLTSGGSSRNVAYLIIGIINN